MLRAVGQGLHSGYSFPLLEARKLGPEFVRKHFAMLARHPGHWPAVAFCNHDIVRTLTRFGGPDAPPALAKMMLALLFSLKSTALIYQGEELGLPQALLRRDQLKDPVGDLWYPYTGGRDGCRTRAVERERAQSRILLRHALASHVAVARRSRCRTAARRDVDAGVHARLPALPQGERGATAG